MFARFERVPPLVIMLGLSALLMLVPSARAFLNHQAPVGRAFLHSSLICLLLSVFLGLATSGQGPRLSRSRGSILGLLTAVYLLVPAVMALPISEAMPSMRFRDAWFEMIASFTTTGATLIDLPARTSDAIHLWRGMAGWLGGLFILSSATALLAPLRLGGFEMIRRNPVGSQRGGRMVQTPGERLRAHAMVILPAYGGFTLALWIILTTLGLPGFDALMQAMAVLSTSGILSRASLGGVGLGAEIAIFAFLVVALSRRFLPGYGGRARSLRSDPELLTAMTIVGLVTLFVVARHWAGAFEEAEGKNLPAMGRAAWGAAFTSLSFLTTTGFVSESWIASRAWSGLTPPGLILMGLALLGGGVATTAGGIKLIRAFSLMRLSKHEAERMIFPHIVPGGNEYERFLTTSAARSAWLLAMVFAFTSIGVLAALLLTGMTLETGLIFTAAALTNTGPLIQYAGELPLYWVLLNDPARLILALSMILGRLEILVLLAAVLEWIERR